jgi:molybdate transport repressor ModE-like protein
MTRMSVRVEFNETGTGMGPKIASLLDRVQERGSIRKAAASLGMGYHNCWSLIHGLQDEFGAKIVWTVTGGSKGGGAGLTPFGTELLASFRRIEAGAIEIFEAEMRKLGRKRRNTRNLMSSDAEQILAADRNR